MRHHALLCLCLTLSGCGGIENWREAAAFGREPPEVAADGPVMRRLMGQDALDQPLLPQPGNIWADVLPAVQPDPPSAASAGYHGEHRPAEASPPGAGAPRPVRPATAAADPAVTGPAAPALAAVVPLADPLPPTAPASAAGPASPASASLAGNFSPAETVAAVGVGVASTGTGVASARSEVAAAGAGTASAGTTVATAVPRAAFRPEVQLAAAQSAQSAEAEWRRLRRDAPTLTEGRLPAVREAEVNGRHVWRLRAAGFADVAEASAFCTGIRVAKAECWVVPGSASP